MMKVVRMLNKKEVLAIMGISTTSKSRLKLFRDLPKYKNPYSKTKMFRMDDVEELIQNFERVS